ncbi:MAG: hypothetical protein DYH02_12250 [Candidatus Omnitrophica bacterium COP1]|nr:hypothetical protein [Candidatus Omnitrophica bacterium COP1]
MDFPDSIRVISPHRRTVFSLPAPLAQRESPLDGRTVASQKVLAASPEQGIFPFGGWLCVSGLAYPGFMQK